MRKHTPYTNFALSLSLFPFVSSGFSGTFRVLEFHIPHPRPLSVWTPNPLLLSLWGQSLGSLSSLSLATNHEAFRRRVDSSQVSQVVLHRNAKFGQKVNPAASVAMHGSHGGKKLQKPLVTICAGSTKKNQVMQKVKVFATLTKPKHSN